MKKVSISVNNKSLKKDALRWQAFENACRLPYEQLSDEWNTFFIRMGYTDSKPGELSELIDRAINEQGDIVNASSRLEELAKKAVGEVV